MKASKKRKLEARGWKVGDTRTFLGLSTDEAQYIELKINLGGTVREQRMRRNLTQTALAALVNSSQSRVAKMESGDPSVSVDLQIRTLLALGASRKDISRWMAR
jgi:ribosome-binding protein aMBF1 (putative translation factor)